MVDTYIRLLFGHLIGDYVLQNNWMALNKKDKKMISPILTHCLVYTVCVAVWLLPELLKTSWIVSGMFVCGIFWSHYIFDRFPIVEAWMTFFKGRNYKDTFDHLVRVSSDDKMPSKLDTVKVMFNASYTALVLTVADNTAHLICMYYLVKYYLVR